MMFILLLVCSSHLTTAFSPSVYGSSANTLISRWRPKYSASHRSFGGNWSLLFAKKKGKPSPTSGRGFGKASSPKKTYESPLIPVDSLESTEQTMELFFDQRKDWIPIFESLAVPDCQAASDNKIKPTNDAVAFNDESPWKVLPAIPGDDESKVHLATFLDRMQQSLLAIPVTDSEEDENDLQFVEEGRRMLAVDRFHVLNNKDDSLFNTCWSELHWLANQTPEVDEDGEEVTARTVGSIVLVPTFTEEANGQQDLQRFVDTYVRQPLDWLGLAGDFEVAGLDNFGVPAIRLLYQLSDIPKQQQSSEA